MPKPVQRTRKKGEPGMPPGAKYVGRGTRFGNPNRIIRQNGGWVVVRDNGATVGTFTERDARRFAVEVYRHHLRQHPELVEAAREELAGKDLACWCSLPEKPGQPDYCHRSVLLEVANAPAAV